MVEAEVKLFKQITKIRLNAYIKFGLMPVAFR